MGARTLLVVSTLAAACTPTKMWVASAQIPPTEPDGTMWDDDGTPPDVYAVITVGDHGTDDESFYRRTSYTPEFTNGPRFTVDAGDVFSIELRDFDPGFLDDGYDVITSCDAVVIDDSMIDAGTYSCGSYGTVTLAFD